MSPANSKTAIPPLSREEYEHIHAAVPIACVDIMLITPEEGFLLVKRSTEPAQGQWWLVGGRVYKNETLEEAARRKVREEIGIEITEVSKIGGGYETIFLEDPFGHGKGTHTINTCFLARLTAEDLMKICLDQHHAQHQIFQAIDEQWHPYVKGCVRESKKVLDKILF